MNNIAKDLKDTSKKMVKDVRSNHQFRFIGDNVDFYSKVDTPTIVVPPKDPKE